MTRIVVTLATEKKSKTVRNWTRTDSIAAKFGVCNCCYTRQG